MQKRKQAIAGLYKRKGVWHIDKTIGGVRICESARTSKKEEAERFLAKRMEEHRLASVYGVRPKRVFRQAATYYLNEHAHKKSIDRDAQDLKLLDPWIGELELPKIHDGTLKAFIDERKKQGVKSLTVRRSLAVVRRILNLAAMKWRDEYGLTWLEAPPMLTFPDWGDRREPHPITWEEQTLFFEALPEHLREMCLYKVNTGCREQEVCQLRWDWEFEIPELNTSVFVLPGSLTKNNKERVVVLNSVARAVINRQRGKHPDRVFTYKGRPTNSMKNSSWKRIRSELGLEAVRLHDLRHTAGRRLRAAGVSLETRKDILGHEGGNITTHYSMPEIQELIDAVEKIAFEPKHSTPSLRVIRIGGMSRKTPAREIKKA